jgi:hypothetical protein
LEEIMKWKTLRKLALATAAVTLATVFSVGWSEQRGISLSVESAQARRLYVTPYHYYNPYRHDLSGVSWYAVRAYYVGGPWSGAVSGWPYSWNGWPDYAQRNGIGCTPGSIVNGGDGINYVCQ